MARDQLPRPVGCHYPLAARFLGRPTVVVGEKLTAINVPGDWAANLSCSSGGSLFSKYATDFSTYLKGERNGTAASDCRSSSRDCCICPSDLYDNMSSISSGMARWRWR